jgi:hypothetical protein
MSRQAPPARVTDRHLFRWMFRFLRPVKWRALLACLYLALWIGIEILAVRQTAHAANTIEQVRRTETATAAGFWAWL